MSKTFLIIQREYITRVRNKTFLLSTFLLPIVMILFIFGSVFFAMSSKDSQHKIAVVNDPGFLKSNIKSDSSKLSFVFTSGIDSSNFIERGYDAVLNLNGDSTASRHTVFSKKQLGIETKNKIEDRLNRAYQEHLLQRNGIEKSTLDSIDRRSADAYAIDNRVINEKGMSEEVNAERNYAIGFISGILIYLTMFIFGAMVMRGVMEEKTNRIAEVMVSSVKPFELMMGKILGIAAVGLTQFILWIVLMTILSTAASAIFSSELLQQAQQANQAMPMNNNTATLAQSSSVLSKLSGINWPLILGSFAFYFLGGYLFYASLFAAIGSVINEDPQEAQSLMLPITMPIIFAFIILSSNLNTPDSPVMVWASMIPFTSPIVMMGRIPSGVPWYQLAASMALLVAGFLFTTWLAGKIYRTGILMYGKKASWKEMFKWAFRKS